MSRQERADERPEDVHESIVSVSLSCSLQEHCTVVNLSSLEKWKKLYKCITDGRILSHQR